MIEEGGQAHLVETLDEALDLKRWLGERRPVLAVDTETSGLDWWRGNLRLVQFGDTRDGWVVPYQGWTALCREIFAEYTGELVFHNAKFDLHWLERAGCKVRRHLVHDTSVMAHLLSPTKPTALKSTAERLIDSRAAAGQTELKKAMASAKWTWGTVPEDFGAYWQYAALDTTLTAKLFEHMWPRVQTDYRYVYDLEMACVQIILDMEERGARVDLNYCAAKQQEFEDYAANARKWLTDEHDCLPSGKKLAAALLSAGVHLTKTTNTGWCLDADVLEGLDHPIATTALAARKAEKLAHSYFGNFRELAEGDIIHPGVRLLGAKTGRMSIANPSMQNLPRGPVVRDAFIAREGNTLLGIDYEQVEMRLLAHLSADTDLIAAFGSGEDFFTAMARQIFLDPALVKSDPRRQVTKASMYAKVYGAGIDKFAVTAGIPVDEARSFMGALDSAFPGMRRFSNQVQDKARDRLLSEGEMYVKTAYGRRLVVDYEGEEYKLVNALIQGSAADLFKQVIVELDAAGLADYLVLPVHDELLFDVPIDEVEELQQAICGVMERSEYAVPLAVDPHTADRWGKLK